MSCSSYPGGVYERTEGARNAQQDTNLISRHAHSGLDLGGLDTKIRFGRDHAADLLIAHDWLDLDVAHRAPVERPGIQVYFRPGSAYAETRARSKVVPAPHVDTGSCVPRILLLGHVGKGRVASGASGKIELELDSVKRIPLRSLVVNLVVLGSPRRLGLENYLAGGIVVTDGPDFACRHRHPVVQPVPKCRGIWSLAHDVSRRLAGSGPATEELAGTGFGFVCWSSL